MGENYTQQRSKHNNENYNNNDQSHVLLLSLNCFFLQIVLEPATTEEHLVSQIALVHAPNTGAVKTVPVSE